MNDPSPPALNILLIDPDSRESRRLKDLLSGSPWARFQVEECGTYEGSQQALVNGRYDAVLLGLRGEDRAASRAIQEFVMASCGEPLILYTADGSLDEEARHPGAREMLALTRAELASPFLERAILNAVKMRQMSEQLKRSEIASQQNERRLVEILDSIRDNLFELDHDWRFTFINAHFADFAGIPQEAMLGKVVWQLFPDMLGTEYEGVYRRVMQTRQPERFEIQSRVHDLWYDIQVYPSETGILVFWHDITERMKAQQAWQDSEEKFTRAFMASPAALSLSRLIDGQYLEVNDAFVKLTGYSHAEAVGHTSTELGLIQNSLEREKIAAMLRAQGTIRNYELKVRPRSGGQVTMLLSVDLLDFNGEACMLSTGIDITERKLAEVSAHQTEIHLRATAAMLERSEAALRARASELSALMDAVPAMIWISRDSEAREVVGNRFGSEFLRMAQGANLSESAPLDSLRQQPYRSYRNGQEIPPSELPIQVTSKTGLPSRNYEFDMIFKDGSIYHLVGNVNPLFGPEGQPSGAVGAFVDITELRRLQEERLKAMAEMEVQRRLIEQREQERQSIARDLHDGPIQSLSGTGFHIKLIKEAYPDPGLHVELDQVVMNIKNSVRELREVINDLRPPALMHFGLSRVIQMYVMDFRERHPEIEIEMEIQDDGHRLTDQACLALFRVFQEGLTNIIHHSSARHVWVTYQVLVETFHLEIRDDGQGFQVDENYTQLTRDGHFGLAGMKERAEAINGVFTVSSGDGQGTTLRVTGPLQGNIRAEPAP